MPFTAIASPIYGIAHAIIIVEIYNNNIQKFF